MRWKALVAVLCGVIVIGAAGTAWAVIGGDGVVDSCFSQAKGTWRPMEHGVACRSGEERLQMYTKDVVDQKLADLAAGGSALVTERWNLRADRWAAPVAVGDFQVVAGCFTGPQKLLLLFYRGGVPAGSDTFLTSYSGDTMIAPLEVTGSPGGVTDPGPHLIASTRAWFQTRDDDGNLFADGPYCHAVSVLQQAP